MLSLSSRFSPSITSYDFLKIFALVTMLIDHVGWFFYPENDWFRVIGRMSFPVWIFLIGYARTRDIPKSFWIGGGLMVAFNVIFGEFILPVNVLFTMMIVRLCLDRITSVVFRSDVGLYTFLFFCTFLALPSLFLFDYGTLAFLMALSGYAVRNRDELFDSRIGFAFFCVVVFLGHWSAQWATFSFSVVQAMVFAVLLAITFAVLVRFRPREYPDLTGRLPDPVRFVIQFCGRYTLEIYVIHFLVFYFIHILNKQGWGGIEWFSPRLFF